MKLNKIYKKKLEILVTSKFLTNYFIYFRYYVVLRAFKCLILNRVLKPCYYSKLKNNVIFVFFKKPVIKF